jgi:hypothetical protein
VTITVSCSSGTHVADYELFMERCPDALLYHTPAYHAVLSRICDTGEPVLLAAWRNNRIAGAMTFFLKSGECGRVANASPYFGSHGDILVAGDEADPDTVADLLAREFAHFCTHHRIVAANVVCHPLRPRFSALAKAYGFEKWDSRIGQISHLPELHSADPLDLVLAGCHQKTRNLVRKGLRAGFSIDVSDKDCDWDDLCHYHSLGMERIGGRAKKPYEFQSLRAALKSQCRLYVARKDGIFAGALLNLYFRDWIEYYTPISVEAFRSDQVLSALIATAMCDGLRDGSRVWNWGGTWSTQAGVYHFKKGWGAKDYPYYYCGALWDENLASLSPDMLDAQFRYFYVRPYAR